MRSHAAIPLALALVTAPLGAAVTSTLDFHIAYTGAGCDSNGGPAPILLTMQAYEKGAEVDLSFPGYPGSLEMNDPLTLIVGLTNPQIDLAPIGIPGGTLLASPDVVVPMSPAGLGAAAYGEISIPNSPSMVGLVFFAQIIQFKASPYHLGLSDGLMITVI